MLQKLSEVQNLVLYDDWVIQTNGLFFESKSIIMCGRMKLSEEQLIVKFSCLKTGKFLIRWIIFETFCVMCYCFRV